MFATTAISAKKEATGCTQECIDTSRLRRPLYWDPRPVCFQHAQWMFLLNHYLVGDGFCLLSKNVIHLSRAGLAGLSRVIIL